MKRAFVLRVSGFSLLEAIVALLLVTMLSMTAFSWISNLLISIEKIEENAYENLIQRNVIEFLADVNMMAQPSGEQLLGGVNIRWSATLIEPIKRGNSMVGGKTPFELGLYKVAVDVSDVAGNDAQFELTQVGYRALPDNIF